MYIQESGRGSRDGLLSCATILCSSADLDRRFIKEHRLDIALRNMLFVGANFFLKILLAAVLQISVYQIS